MSSEELTTVVTSSDSPPPVAVTCRYTRSELQELLKESGYGANDLMFNAFFVAKSSPARCGACGRFVGEHDEVSSDASAAASNTQAVVGVSIGAETDRRETEAAAPIVTTATTEDDAQNKKKKERPSGLFPYPEDEQSEMLILRTYTTGQVAFIALPLIICAVVDAFLIYQVFYGQTIFAYIAPGFALVCLMGCGMLSVMLLTTFHKEYLVFDNYHRRVVASTEHFPVGTHCWGSRREIPYHEIGAVDIALNRQDLICRVKQSMEPIRLTIGSTAERDNWAEYLAQLAQEESAEVGFSYGGGTLNSEGGNRSDGDDDRRTLR